jgi:MFS family permease
VLLIAPLAFGLREPGFGGGAVPPRREQTILQAAAEAFRYPSFQLLMAGYFVCGFQVVFIGVHMPSYLKDKGLTPDVATTALALIGLFNIVGTLSAGYLGGRFSKKYLLSTIYSVRAVLISMLVFLPLTAFNLYAFAIGIGLLWLGTVPLTNGLVGQIFGMRYAAMLASIVFFGHQIGSFVGVWLAGYLYDHTGSYSGAFLASIGLGIFAAIVNLPVNEKPLAERMKHAQAVA